jgi:hypothetical protein
MDKLCIETSYVDQEINASPTLVGGLADAVHEPFQLCVASRGHGIKQCGFVGKISEEQGAADFAIVSHVSHSRALISIFSGSDDSCVDNCVPPLQILRPTASCMHILTQSC